MSKISSPDKWASEEKFAVVMETSSLSEVELSDYCRVKGLYPEQIKSCIAGNTTKPSKRVKQTPEQKADNKRIKSLERELRRKKRP